MCENFLRRNVYIRENRKGVWKSLREWADHDVTLTPNEGAREGRLDQNVGDAVQPTKVQAALLVSLWPTRTGVLDSGAGHGKSGLNANATMNLTARCLGQLCSLRLGVYKIHSHDFHTCH